MPPTIHHACNRTHGTAGELLSLIPAPAPTKTGGDPFVTLSPRAAKAWMALFAHSQQHGTWRRRPIDPTRPELTQGQQYTLAAHWTVQGLGYAMGVNRDTAGKSLQELVLGGWVRREDPRNKGQFGGIDYSLRIPTTVTQADKARVGEGLKKRGVEFVGYRWRTAARVLDDHEIKRVQEEILLEMSTDQADVTGEAQKAIELVSEKITRMAKGE